MKIFQRAAIVMALGLVASGGFAVMQARTQYYGVCSELSGFPGMLQKAGMLMVGNCVSRPGESLCSPGATCTVGSKSGTCRNTARPGETAICSCILAISPNSTVN